MYKEYGRYKIELLKKDVYHIDENTKAIPAGAMEEDGSYNNPSSMYLILNELGAVLVDLGYGPKSEQDLFNFQNLLETFIGNKPLTILFTHNHFDHIGFLKHLEVFANIKLENIYISKKDFNQDLNFFLITPIDDQDVLKIYGDNYQFYNVGAHTPGSLFVYNETNKELITGDTFGSGYVWIVFDHHKNPLKVLEDGLKKVMYVCKENDLILAGHRYQQFDLSNKQRPEEMNRTYFLDMLEVLEGLKNNTTTILPYDVVDGAIELSKENKKAKIDTFDKYVQAYLESR